MPKNHTVVEGDCLENIAFKYGFFPKTVWEHPDNADLRDRRDSAVLRPGDVVVIPDPGGKNISVTTGKTHKFLRRGVPSRFRVHLDFEERSLAGLQYTLDIDSGALIYKGTLDDSGRVDHPMPPDSRRAKLTLGEGEDREVYEFDLGKLDVVEEREGVVQRLRGLGYLEDETDVSDRRLAAALTRFQDANSLDPTGEPNDATRDALVDAYGC